MYSTHPYPHPHSNLDAGRWTLDVGYDVLAVPAVQGRCVARYGVDSGTVDGEPGPGDGFQVPGPGGGCLDGC